jgi:hypothetical protein
VLVDVPQRDVVPDGVGQGGEEDHRIPSDHHPALRAVGRAGDAEVGRQDRRNGRVHLPGQGLDVLGDNPPQCLVQSLQREPPELLVGQEPLAHRKGDHPHLDGAAPGRDAQQGLLPAHVDVGDGQSVEDVHRGRPLGHRRQVVVAHQEKDRNPGIGQLLHPSGEGPLVGGIGVAGLVGVAGEDDQVGGIL